MATAPAAVALFAGLATSATWLYVHQHYFRKWRGLDDARVLKAIEKRDKKHLRVPFEKTPIRQRLARIATWGLLLTLSPIGFGVETFARVSRNMGLRGRKRRYERRRDRIEARTAASAGRIERMAKEAASGDIQELPKEVGKFTRKDYDLHFSNAATPPVPVPSGPAGAGDAEPDDDDPYRRRRGHPGGSLV
jgi:hypothetical protein